MVRILCGSGLVTTASMKGCLVDIEPLKWRGLPRFCENSFGDAAMMERLILTDMKSPIRFERVSYLHLNARQKENFNFQKVSAVLADYGFVTIRLSDDWQGADFIAHHINGESFLKVQLKGRLTVDTKYKDKDIWICFSYKAVWYLFPHDKFLCWALENTTIGTTRDWESPDDWERVRGIYTWPSPTKDIIFWLRDNGYALTN
jgi:hypothetical protein